MTSLNLSNDALVFINAIDRKDAKLIWKRLGQLLEGNGDSEIAPLGEGMLMTNASQYLIVFRRHEDTIYIDSVGRKEDAWGQKGPIIPPAPSKPVANILKRLKLDDSLIALFTSTTISLLFALTIDTWFSRDFSLFQPLMAIAFLTCLAGLATGIRSKDDRLFKFMPVAFLSTIAVGLSFQYLGFNKITFLSRALWQYTMSSSSHFSSFVIPGLTLIGTTIVLLIPPFSCSVLMGCRLGKLFNSSRPLTAYLTVVAAALTAYLLIEIATALSIAPVYPVAAVAMVQLALAGPVPTGRLLSAACLVLAALAMVVSAMIDQHSHSIIYYSLHYAPLYATLTLVLVGVLIWLWRPLTFAKAESLLNWQLFVIGVALSSMVIGSCARLVTIYGHSWLTQGSLTVCILLLALWAGNSMRRPGAVQYELILYIGLFVSLSVSCLLPIHWLLSFGLVGSLLITFLTVIPMFRVLLILPAAYSQAKDPTMLFAYTLAGLSLGLLTEYLLLWSGQTSLLWIALLFFALSFFLRVRQGKGLLPSTAKPSMRRIT